MHRILAEGRWNQVKSAIESELKVLGGKTTSKPSSSESKASGSIYTIKKGDTLPFFNKKEI
ncbi:N-acetylmuramoyl-L-alanine amidase [Bacillus subtilis]|nr:N-acetylmuramoyl-L-alanine amidase; bacteriophage PBSX protein [Bacillus subtilis subsp. subtilis str. BAB-1]ASK23229.1 N-acetylmuramoyl-L-alanine amidase [Bacillus subtilis]